MPHIVNLEGKEALDFIHLVLSKNGTTLDADKQRSLNMIDAACSDSNIKALAKASEEENFNTKSYHRLENRHLRHADKKKMPIDARKVKDILTNKHMYRAKVGSELPTYLMNMEDNQLQKGIMTYMLETAWGKKKDLLDDIGLAKSTNKFLSYTDYRKMTDDALVNPTDGQLANLLQARFTQIDLTDYEFSYDGPEEHPDVLVLDPGYVIPFRTDDAAKSDLLLEEFDMEENENPASSNFHREIHTAQAEAIEAAMRAEAEEEVVIDADMFPDIDFDDDDDDEEEKEEIELKLSDGLTTADGFFQPTEEPEEEENEEAIQRMQKATYLENMEDVVGSEHIREKFNNPEIDAFLKLLNIKPHTQWEDNSGYHYKAATHAYEDESQELDPYYHMVAEVERKHMERQQVQDFRRGTEIKFLLDPKKRPVFHKN
uniref:Uncharacterized protein n=1 Tax=Strombidium inclinatum TaxID=197538 RepID=A0A7S3MZA8_9SPIT|mmetsp:Transcript_32231/g.49307  ORF Transcript_32231/g.49307 Transcript_32231/m.49307 type:complete len:430 (+) Transcript_32231:1206-2495(+)